MDQNGAENGVPNHAVSLTDRVDTCLALMIFPGK